MNGGSIDREWRAAPEDEAGPVELSPPELWSEGVPHMDAPPPRSWPLQLAAAVLAIAWLATALTLAWPALPTLSPIALVEFLATLAAPLALIAIVYALLLRTSRAEAQRFGATARAMRGESVALEASAARLTGAIGDHRRALAEQSAALDQLGESAAARLAGVAREMSAEVARADAAARRLADATDTAHDRLAVVLALLPRAHGETAELAQLLEAAATNVSERAAALDAQVVALADRTRETDALAGGAAQRLSAQVTRVEATGETAGARLEQVTAAMAQAVDALLARTATAVDESRKGIATQGEALLAMIDTSHAALARASAEQTTALSSRIAAIEAAMERITAHLHEHHDAADQTVTMLEARVAALDHDWTRFSAATLDRSTALAAAISALGNAASATTLALGQGDAAARQAIATTEQVIGALDSVAREIDETVPAALDRLDARVGESRAGIGRAKPELLALVTAAESTHTAIEAVAGLVAEEREAVRTLTGELTEALAAGQAQAKTLKDIVIEADTRAHRLSEDAAPRLVDALLRVRETANAAAEHARATLAEVIPEASEALRAAVGDAVARAATQAVIRQLDDIARATEAAVTVGEHAAGRLVGQLSEIERTTRQIDTRIEASRAERETAERDTFSRRVSLLIEALNSASIDITKAFAVDVSDSNWAAYLKGDRGIFTRRAVRLLDTADVREILRLYDTDAPFREQVNRYIHDFEAMLRAILAERDGSPLGVTLLSSDMGKLYVALAQAIERLRT